MLSSAQVHFARADLTRRTSFECDPALQNLYETSPVTYNTKGQSSTNYYCPYRSGGVDYTLYDLYAAGVRLNNTFALSFQVQCPNDAHILLQESASDYYNNVIEIVLGGWANTKSVIRDEQQGTPVAEYSESGIVSGTEYRYFWFSWDSNTIAVGKGDTPYTNEVMSWNGLAHGVYYISIGIGYGTDGYWKFMIVDGGWTDWSAWGTCTTTCGGGSTTRSRTCTNPPASNGGTQCTGDTEQTMTCNSQNCPIDGNWGDWSQWSTCSATCGNQTISRTRSCDNPAAQYGGADCSGSDIETTSSCGLPACPIDGEWGAWSSTSCSSACGYGTLVKTRSCDSPAPSNGGNDCIGSSNETEVCIAQYCQSVGNATYANQCGSGMFTCFNGTVTCIDEVFQCDCENDCDDGSDEDVTWSGCDATLAAMCSSADKPWWNLLAVLMTTCVPLFYGMNSF
ncbi:hemicentin-1-like [Mercenaria mercenaria]|uniref:hemicentin-1-like n=1 Tax=Mercenaria mercenaria TaxID=6596 RepID=UPI00234EDC11|nr:hemicentin-1-like [Mercenaria mercenaria]